MERRWTQRTEAELDIELHFGGYEVADCQLRDISMSGLCLSRGDLAPVQGDALELVFTLGDDGWVRKYRLPARVARVNENDVGIRFRGTNPAAFRALRAIFAQKQRCRVA